MRFLFCLLLEETPTAATMDRHVDEPTVDKISRSKYWYLPTDL